MIGALIHAVSEQYIRQTTSNRQSYNYAWKKLASLIGSTLLLLLASVGMGIIILGLLWVAVFFLDLKKEGGFSGFIPLILMILIGYIVVSLSFIYQAVVV